jgi:ubiquinone/menaquinone biosynthesis C-methylase UbiE
MNLINLTSQDLEKMSYNELIGLTQETNRPPGGIATIMEVAKNTFLNKDSKILEVGTSTGFTAVELALLTKANIHAIDINPVSLEEACKRAETNQVKQHISFEKQDVTELPYENDYFDLAFIGNVFSLVSDAEKAFIECSRVLRKSGFLAAVPMYYTREPSRKLLDDVSEAIQVNVSPLKKDYWMSFFDKAPFKVCFSQDYQFDTISTEKVEQFAKHICSREHLKQLPKETMRKLQSLYYDYMQLFKENLSHMGFTVLVLRKEIEYDEELFTATLV